MRRMAAAAFLICCSTLVWAAGQPNQVKPIPAAEGERRARETRDFIVDLVWEHTDTYWHVGNYEECTRLLAQCVELDPYFVEAWTSKAWMLSNLDRDEEAAAAYHDAMRYNPDDPSIYQQFGLFYQRRHRYEEAIAQFREATKRGALRGWQHMLPATLEDMGRKEEALDEWRAIVGRFPDDEVAKMHIEKLERELGEGKA